MCSVLLHVYRDECFEPRFQAALDLARQFDGSITCAQAVPYDFAATNDFYGTMAAEMMVEYDKVAKEKRDRVESRLANEDVTLKWVESSVSAARLISSQAPLNDIVAIGGGDSHKRPNSPSRLATELTERVRAPGLVVPESVRPFDLGRPAMVAWNGAKLAVHALRMAILLLSRTIAETLMDAAVVRKGGYLVLGAYGHSRYRERVLGGATRGMLRKPRLLLLLAH